MSRKRHFHTHRGRRTAHRKPGSTFRPRAALVHKRKGFPPEVLAASDWLVYRRSCNPYRAHTYFAARYRKAYAAAKLETPRPGWPPLKYSTRLGPNPAGWYRTDGDGWTYWGPRRLTGHRTQPKGK